MMRIYHSMPLSEFIAAIRDSAIAVHAGPLAIDKLDELAETADEQAELPKHVKKLQGEVDDLQAAKDDLLEELCDLLMAAEDRNDDIPEYWDKPLKAARMAVARHGGREV